MARKNQWVVPIRNGWGVFPENSTRVKLLSSRKEEAIDYGWALAKKNKVDLVIYNHDGSIAAIRSGRTHRKQSAKE